MVLTLLCILKTIYLIIFLLESVARNSFPPMSPPIKPFLIFSLLIISISLSQAQSPRRPNALLLPISKHLSTLQYLTNLSIGTPLVPTTFVVDLAGKTFLTPCSIEQANATDTISLPSTNGSTSGPSVKIPNFAFLCAENRLRKGLPSGAKGTVGLQRSSFGLSTQISAALGSHFGRKFALCLPSSSSFFVTNSGKTSYNGVLFFGNTPYFFYPSYNESRLIDATQRFSYTKLHVNPTTTSDYFVQVTSILINKKPIPLNTTLLRINNRGIGGTKISTVVPYTVLESSIYKVLTTEFAKELKAMRVKKVAPVAPFTECFSTEFMGFTPLGAGVPDVTFVFENKDAYWELNGFNLMVEISREVVCLGFVDGGSRPKTSIVIGARQLEDNLFEFDLAASRLGFSYTTLLFDEVLCSNFKF